VVPPTTGGSEANERAFGDWLVALPEGCGLLACRDPVAALVGDHARDRNLAVPERLGIVSGLDEELPSEPPLTAVHISVERWGLVAAQVLSTWLATGQRPAAETLLPPEDVVVRASTSTVAFSDPLINLAITFIRERADHPLAVSVVAKAMHTSRRSLERRFAAVVGRTILAEIHRAHLALARVLLVDSDLPLKTVAQRCGLRSEEQLRRLFLSATGATPGAWRQRFRDR
jgi:LacI family transcriptional regulator